jgi:mono/diheme cytochrome c family protein
VLDREGAIPLIRILRKLGLCTVVICGIVAVFTLEAHAQGNGKDLFLKNQCNKCHTITAQKIDRLKRDDDDGGKQPPDLSHVGKERNATWIVGWLERTEKLKGKSHKKKFTGSAADAQALATWLAGMK